jgi:serine protease
MKKLDQRRPIVIRKLLAIAGVMFIGAGSMALHAQMTPQGKAALRALPSNAEVAYIVVKFRDENRVRVGSNGKLQQKLSSGVAAVDAKLATGLAAVEAQALRSKLQVRRHFGEQTEAQIDQLMNEARLKSPQPLADLNSYYSMRLPAGSRFADVAALVDSFAANEAVEFAYAAPVPQTGQAATPNFQPNQGYLGEPPNGINATWGLQIPGARGDGVHLVNVELGWNPGHEDFPPLFYSGGTFTPVANDISHGTAVVGLIAARHNGLGTSGIAPNTQVGVQAAYTISVAQAVTIAAGQIGPGGIILIELHAQGPNDGTACTCNQPQCNFVAMEFWQAEFDAIRTATQSGRIVVEIAGNGSANLDAAAYGGNFNRNQRDSGAIMVGAGLSTARSPACFTNFGGRVDMHSWGENVATLGYGDLFNGGNNRLYTATFGGTSSATPITAGAASMIQGARLAAGRPTLTSVQMRTLLANNGTAQTGDLARNIGPMPNVRAAMTADGLVPGPNLRWLPAILQTLLE